MSVRPSGMLINTVVRYVADQDAAIAFWTGAMGLELRRDAEMAPGQRWVEVVPPGRETAVALLRAADFGLQPQGGDAGFTLVVEDVREFHARMVTHGVEVTEPVAEGYGTFVTVSVPDGYQLVVSQLQPPPEAGS